MDEKWIERFMGLAQYIGSWSKDPDKQVGAVIVDPVARRVRGMGYNGPPPTIPDLFLHSEDKNDYVVHAEINALMSATETQGCWIFIYPLPPCLDCAKAIVASGIKKVVTTDLPLPEKWKPEVTKQLLYIAGVDTICGKSLT